MAEMQGNEIFRWYPGAHSLRQVGTPAVSAGMSGTTDLLLAGTITRIGSISLLEAGTVDLVSMLAAGTVTLAGGALDVGTVDLIKAGTVTLVSGGTTEQINDGTLGRVGTVGLVASGTVAVQNAYSAANNTLQFDLMNSEAQQEFGPTTIFNAVTIGTTVATTSVLNVSGYNSVTIMGKVTKTGPPTSVKLWFEASPDNSSWYGTDVEGEAVGIEYGGGTQQSLIEFTAGTTYFVGEIIPWAPYLRGNLLGSTTGVAASGTTFTCTFDVVGHGR